MKYIRITSNLKYGKRMINNTIFKQKNLETVDINKELNFAKSLIRDIQITSIETQECFLSFYPLAKNIRFISSHFFKAIKNNKKPVLSMNPRPGENVFWEQRTQNNWFPWFWTRYLSTNNSNQESWLNLFKNIEDEIICSLNKENLNISDFILYLACLDHIFRLNDNLQNNLKLEYGNIIWPEDKVVCALQIRRGEIVPKDGNIKNAWKGRPIFEIDDYINGLKEICAELRTNTVFISTDSREVINYLINNYKEYNFIYNNFDHTKFITYEGGEPNLEIDLQKKPELIKLYTESCLIDLDYLSKCQGYVGGMTNSEYGLCGWFLQMTKQKKIYPYFNVEGELDLNNSRTGLLLL